MIKKREVFVLLLAVFAITLFFAACSAAAVVSETNGWFIRILLDNNKEKFHAALAEEIEWNAEWKCITSGDGAIEEMAYRDYLIAVDEKFNQNEPEEFLIPDESIVGGPMEFYFKGVRPGLVDLRIVCESPDRPLPYVEAIYRVTVSEDLKLEVQELSEKYDWGDP